MDQELNNILRRMSEMKKSTGQQEPESHNCNICKDKGFIFKTQGLYEVAIKCKCQAIAEAKQRMERSGLGNLLETKSFDNYETNHEFQRVAKDMAIDYTKEFLKGNRYSLAILGQSGTGKSHLMAAVARQLMENNIDVKYFTGDEIVQTLQACKFDELNYNIEFGKITNAGVLLIDDLFKSAITNYYNKESINPNDLREIFKVINYRYNKKLPILLNSEIDFDRFRDLDQATIGRINEMCNYKYLLSIKPDTNKNYRLKARSL